MNTPSFIPSAADERYPIRIRRDGVWLYQGSPIGRIELVRLFASVLKLDDSGDYWLITPAERGRITVDDVPFIAVELEREGEFLKVRTNIDQWVTLDAAHPLNMRDGIPYIEVRAGLQARCTQSVYYQLAAMAGVESGRMGVRSGGIFFELGEMPHDA